MATMQDIYVQQLRGELQETQAATLKWAKRGVASGVLLGLAILGGNSIDREQEPEFKIPEQVALGCIAVSMVAAGDKALAAESYRRKLAEAERLSHEIHSQLLSEPEPPFDV